jgi:hypothetical protein
MFGLASGQDWLSISSNIAQAVTGLVAGIAGIRFLCQRRARRKRLETYLTGARQDAEASQGKGSAKSIQHLMGNCLMTEAQILEAAFASDKVQSWLTVDVDGFAGRLLFQLNDEAWNNSKRSN